MKRTVLCVIPSYNGSTELVACVDSIRRSPPNCQTDILVVDNASDPAHYHRLQSINDIQVIRNQRNLGFGAASNIGFRVALHKGYDFVLLVNQDVSFEAGAIDVLLKVAQSHGEIGLVSPVQLSQPGTIDTKFASNVPDAFADVMGDLIKGAPREVYRVRFVNAACWLLTPQFIKTVGGFDPIFFMYGEDNELCRRAGFRGQKLGVALAAQIIHERESKAPQSTVLERIRWASVKQFSNLILHSRQYNRSFQRNLLGVSRQFLAVFVANAMAGDIEKSVGVTLAALKFASTLRKNRANFIASIREEMPFL